MPERRVPTLTATRGLPASGKTTYALARLAEAEPGSLVRISRDPLARMLHNGRPHEQKTERQITAIQHAAIEQQLRAGVDVIVDDCNLATRYVRALAEIAWRVGAEFEVRSFDVPVLNCVTRDANRAPADRVGAKVIADMAQRYLRGDKPPSSLPIPQRPEVPKGLPYVPDENLPLAVLCDIDGTVARHEGIRDPYDTSRYSEDAPNLPVITAVLAMKTSGHEIVFMSGRDAAFRDVTTQWLNRYFGPMSWRELHMRPQGDKRRDDVVKLELFDQHIRNRWCITAAWDDRDRVVRAYRDVLGLPVFQVADGSF